MVPESQDYESLRHSDEEVSASGLAPWRKAGLVLLAMGFLGAAGVMSQGGTSNATSLATTQGPAMIHLPQIAQTKLPDLPNTMGSKSYLGDLLFSRVPGKDMTAGLYRLNKGPALHYTYTYEEFKYIMQGEFHLTDGTGQKLVAREGDLMYFPQGTKIIFETPETALGYFMGQRQHEPLTSSDPTVAAAIASNPKMVLFPRIWEKIGQQAKLPNADGSNSFLTDYFFSTVPGKEMTVGFYLDQAGPALHYTYTYEEFKYIMEGEYHISDGTGQKVVAKKGDLMLFPKGAKITFETPEMGLGLFCGQRTGGTVR